jgi:flagellar biosynthesis protein FliP
MTRNIAAMGTQINWTRLCAAGLFALVTFGSASAFAADGSLFDLPLLKLDNLPAGGQSLSLSLQTLILMSALTILPSMVLVTTSFTRIIITLSILRQAMGTQQTPPNQILVGLALFMTLFIMTPTIREINDTAFAPYSAGQISIEQAGVRTGAVMKQFMMHQTRQSDILMVAELRGDKAYESPADVPFLVAVPAYLISELRTAFTIGFLLYLPFLVIDIVVASILMSLGMMMLSPMLVSLPFKLLMFVIVDGWSLTLSSLVESFTRGG